MAELSFIGKLIIGSFWCFGIFKIFDDLLLSVRAKLEEKIGIKWSKPLVSCPPCMGSVHGLLMGAFFYAGSPLVILYAICLCGLNYLIQTFLPEYE
jgi:hypothetical protein